MYYSITLFNLYKFYLRPAPKKKPNESKNASVLRALLQTKKKNNKKTVSGESKFVVFIFVETLNIYYIGDDDEKNHCHVKVVSFFAVNSYD